MHVCMYVCMYTCASVCTQNKVTPQTPCVCVQYKVNALIEAANRGNADIITALLKGGARQRDPKVCVCMYVCMYVFVCVW